MTSSGLPESNAGHINGFLFGLAPGGVYLAAMCYHSRGALLPHPFTLTASVAEHGGLLSAALSVGSRPPGVTWHLALWSPDFPPAFVRRPATVRPTLAPSLGRSRQFHKALLAAVLMHRPGGGGRDAQLVLPERDSARSYMSDFFALQMTAAIFAALVGGSSCSRALSTVC